MTREDLAKENNSNRIMPHYEPILSTIMTKRNTRYNTMTRICERIADYLN